MISRDSLYLRIFVVAAVATIYDVAVVAVDPSVIRTTPKLDVNRIYLKPGDRLDLTYECTDESELRFNADKVLGEGTPGFRSYWDNKVFKVKLSITVKMEDSGQYICELKSRKARDTLDILVVNITGKNDVLSEKVETVSISCSVENLNGYSMEWYKQGKKLTAGTTGIGERSYNIMSNGTLIINKATCKDIGQYDCVVFPDPDEYPECNITESAFVKFGLDKPCEKNGSLRVIDSDKNGAEPRLQWLNQTPLKILFLVLPFLLVGLLTPEAI